MKFKKIYFVNVKKMPLDMPMDIIKQEAAKLKPGDVKEIVIKLTKEELAKQLTWKLKDGTYFEYDPKKNRIILYKPAEDEKKCLKQFEEMVGVKPEEELAIAIEACSKHSVIPKDVPGLDEELRKSEEILAFTNYLEEVWNIIGWIVQDIKKDNLTNKKLLNKLSKIEDILDKASKLEYFDLSSKSYRLLMEAFDQLDLLYGNDKNVKEKINSIKKKLKYLYQHQNNIW